MHGGSRQRWASKYPPPPGKASPVKAAGTGRAVGRAAQPEFPQVVEEEEEAGGRT